MRGKVAIPDDAPRFERITPAYAGKSRSQGSHTAPPGDHPRVCGEKLEQHLQQARQRGSPPRMRGKGFCNSIAFTSAGITPAYAGKSEAKEFACKDGRDHPPRMRGKVFASPPAMLPTGITPAYAGKRKMQTQTQTRKKDHPRVCGEKRPEPSAGSIQRGSPPRMRGKDPEAISQTSTGGITPAYAGKSARRQAGPPGPAPPPQMRLGWSPPPCTGRQCRTRKSTHARRARIPAPAHTPAPQ